MEVVAPSERASNPFCHGIICMHLTGICVQRMCGTPYPAKYYILQRHIYLLPDGICIYAEDLFSTPRCADGPDQQSRRPASPIRREWGRAALIRGHVTVLHLRLPWGHARAESHALGLHTGWCSGCRMMGRAKAARRELESSSGVRYLCTYSDSSPRSGADASRARVAACTDAGAGDA